MLELSKQSLAIRISEDLREKIVTHVIPCGTKINARKLQNDYQTSSTPIREALNILVADSLVEYQSNIGCRVISFSKLDILEINDIIALTDCHAVELAIVSASVDVLIKDLYKLVEDQQSAYDSGDEPLYRYCTEHFHDIFYEYAGNSRLQVLYKKYNSQMKMLAARYESHQNRKISLREHALIYHAVKDRDVFTAVNYMRKHIFATRDLLMNNYDTMMK